MVVLAGGFLTFIGFLFAGLLALGFTAVMDRSLGKEKALLLFSFLLLLFTLWQCTPAKTDVRPRLKAEKAVPAERLDVKGEPYARPSLTRDPDSRNPFQKHSDTKPLAPVELQLPPWLALPYELPPTVPGPAPGARHLLRGPLPATRSGDGSTIPDIPPAIFADYQPVPDDVYDWIVSTGRKTYVYIRAIRHEGKLHEDDEPGFLPRLMVLAGRLPGWEGMQVEYALVGSEETAARNLEATAVLKKRRESRTTAPANQFDNWFPRRTVEVLYREALQDHGLPEDPSTATNIAGLRNAAKAMAAVGATGKEDKEGWRRSAKLLEHALKRARTSASPTIRVEILEDLVEAYVALREEKHVLRVLTEYAETSPMRPEPWLWLGRFHLNSLGLPVEALAYFETAVARSTRSTEAWVGKGDALSALGMHEDAHKAYQKAGNDYEAKVRAAESLLRLGRLSEAKYAAASAMSGDEQPARALLVTGAIAYAEGDFDEARTHFEQAATSSGGDALEYRAQACYDLGLTCWRRGEGDAALAAFEACDRAQQFGAAAGRFDDETVSPAFGRALVELSSDNESAMRTSLQSAREEAPRVSYHDVVTGIVASLAEDDAAAVRAFERAMRLTEFYPELDGWLAKTRLRLGQLALAARTPMKEAAADFEAAVAFARRASTTEAAIDKKAYGAQLREAWILLGAEHLGRRERFEKAREVANRVITRIDREQPGALTIRGYCNFRLAEFGLGAVGEDVDDPYDPCIRDFQLVLNKVPADADNEWATWRQYAADALASVKHWKNLEELVVSMDEATLEQLFKRDERKRVRGSITDGVLRLDDAPDQDGTLDDATWVLRSDQLFKVGTFEEVRFQLRLPSRDAQGDALNTITFGVQVQRASRSSSSRARYAGIGIFYDQGKLALRIGGGQEERWKEGNLLRMAPEEPWPSDEWVEVRIVRVDDKEGRMQVWLDADPADGTEGQMVIEDTVAGFKGTTKTPAQLWIGGFSPQAQQWFVELKDIRVIRRKR